MKTETIYISLVDEPFWRPTQGIPLGAGLYEVLATERYGLVDEVWEFPPGSVVRCVPELRDGEVLLIAKELARNSGENSGDTS